MSEGKIVDKALSSRCIYGSEIMATCPVRTAFINPPVDSENMMCYCDQCPYLMEFKIIMVTVEPKPKKKKTKKKVTPKQ